MSLQYTNFGHSTLVGAYTAGDATITVTSAATFPATNDFWIKLGGSTGFVVRKVTGVAGAVFTLGAVANNGVDANVSAGGAVDEVQTQEGFDQFKLDTRPIAINTGLAAVVPFGPVFQFTDPTIPAFAWVNQGTASIANLGPTATLTLPVTAGNNLRLRTIVAPARPYTIDAAFLITVNPQTIASSFDAGLAFYESGSGKLITFGILSPNPTTLAFTKWTNFTTFSAFYNNINVGTLLSGLIWLRVSDDGVNLTVSISADGVNWTSYTAQARNNFFTAGPDNVGFYGDNSAAGGTSFLTIISWKQH